MRIWLDAQLSPGLAAWIRSQFADECTAVRELGLRDALDRQIFEAARVAQAVVMTKDSDFVALVQRLGSPPQVVLLRCGNTSNARLRALPSVTFPQTRQLLEAGESIVEISEPWQGQQGVRR